MTMHIFKRNKNAQQIFLKSQAVRVGRGSGGLSYRKQTIKEMTHSWGYRACMLAETNPFAPWCLQMGRSALHLFLFLLTMGISVNGGLFI